jgi:hypothetical protein
MWQLLLLALARMYAQRYAVGIHACSRCVVGMLVACGNEDTCAGRPAVVMLRALTMHGHMYVWCT